MNPVRHSVADDHGGVARYVEQLVAAQVAARGRRVEVFGPVALRLPTAVERFPYRPIHRPLALDHWKFALLAAAQASRIAGGMLHHAHGLTFTGADVYTVHGFYTREWLARTGRRPNFSHPMRILSRLHFELMRRLERRSLSTARHVVFVSTENLCYAENVLGLARPSAVHIVFPGVDSDRYSPSLREAKAHERWMRFPEISAQARWLLFVGHDYTRKGLLRLLPALAEMASILGCSGTYEILVFGRDPFHRRTAQALARSSGVSAQFFSDDSSLLAAFALSDVLLMDSVSEGFPLVLLEAMASGCVPVVSPCGGVSDCIRDGVNGIVRASAAEIAQVALTIADDALASMSAHARRDACDWHWARVATAYERIYAAV